MKIVQENIIILIYLKLMIFTLQFILRCLVHLSRHGAEISMFAPDKTQYHVINHCEGNPTEGESRYVWCAMCYRCTCIYHICLKKRPGIYFSSGPLHLVLKRDRNLFKVGICSLKLS